MMYTLPLAPETATTARCPRCSFPLLVISGGTDAPAFHYALGEILEFLATAQDAITAIRGTIEEVAQP